jgi:hypothetical protein
MRKYTNHLIGMAQDGLISWESLAHACLRYLTEHDVKEIAEDEFDVTEVDVS